METITKTAIKAGRAALLLMLLAASVQTLTTHRRAISVRAPEVTSTYENAIVQLDRMGRLPMTGEVSGEINNLVQFVSHPSRPDALGCGDQASYVFAQLQTIPGWTFEMRYEFGLSSPILLPHQWITGHGPNGEHAEIDPWADRIEIR